MRNRVLVTGGSGMIGSAIKNIVGDNDEYTFLSSKDCDLRDVSKTDELFKKYRPTHVIHLAANVGGMFKNLQKGGEMFYDNVMMNTNVMEMCRIYEVRHLVCCLSTCIFPDLDSSVYPIDESYLHMGAPHSSNEGYAYSKRMMEVMGRLYSKQYNLKITCVAPCNIYGPNDNFSISTSHVIPGLIRRFEENPSSPIVFGSGNPLRQFIYSDDAARMMLKICFAETPKQFLYILAPPIESSIKNVARIIAKELGIIPENIYYDILKNDGQFRKTVLSSKFEDEFGEFHYTTIEDGLKMTVEWFRRNKTVARL